MKIKSVFGVLTIAALALSLSACSTPSISDSGKSGNGKMTSEAIVIQVSSSAKDGNFAPNTGEVLDARNIRVTVGGSGSEACAPQIGAVYLEKNVVTLEIASLPEDTVCTMDYRAYDFFLSTEVDVFNSDTKVQTHQDDTFNEIEFIKI